MVFFKFNEAQFFLSDVIITRTCMSIIFSIAVSFIYIPLLNYHPLIIESNKHNIFENDIDYIVYYSPFIFLLLVNSIIYLITLLFIIKIILWKKMNLQTNYFYNLFINRQENSVNVFILYTLNVIKLIIYSIIILLCIFIFILICLVYPNRYNKKISSIFTVGFIIVSTIFIILLFIFLLSVIIKCVLDDNNDEYPDSPIQTYKLELIRWLNRHIFEIPENTPDDFFCAICQMNYIDSIKLSSKNKNYVKIPACNHFFHFDCLKQWFQLKQSCPLCNKEITIQESSRNRNVRDL